MDINKRIKQIRKDKDLSQTEFGEKLGVTRGVINNLDRNEVEAKPHFIKHLCEVYHVNENWLRTGNGEMYTETEDTFISNLAKKFEVDDLLKNMITAYLKLDDKEKFAVKKYIETIAETEAKSKPLSREDERVDFMGMANNNFDMEETQGKRTSSAKESDVV